MCMMSPLIAIFFQTSLTGEEYTLFKFTTLSDLEVQFL